MAATYESIATASLSLTTGVTFSSIPNTYTDLRVVLNFQPTDQELIFMRLNNDSNSYYSAMYIVGNDTSITGGTNNNRTEFTSTYATSSGSNGFLTYDIMNYTNTNKHKTVLYQNSLTNASQNYTIKYVGQYKDPARITSVRVFCPNNTFSDGNITLYGIKAA
jgi:hypothetical protein